MKTAKVNIENFEKEMKFKTIDMKFLLLCLDRLTRFKPPVVKKNRVIKDIISKYLIEPKITKKTFDNYPLYQMEKIFSLIWNESVEKCECNLSNYLAFEDTKIFNSQKVLCDYFKIDIAFENSKELVLKEAKKLGIKTQSFDEIYQETSRQNQIIITSILKEVKKHYKNTPETLKRLIELEQYQSLENKELYKKSLELRKEKKLLFPIKLFIITEGITEEILLPKFAKLAGIDFKKEGIYILGAGGKNQVAKLYYETCKDYKIPILILLDNDAKAVENQIEPILKKQDKIFTIQTGEFEDILDKELILRTLNSHFKYSANFTLNDFNDEKMAKNLEVLLKENGLGEFKKAEFAKLVSQNIKDESDLTSQINMILNYIKVLIN